MARKATGAINFRNPSYQTINSFDVVKLPDSPDVGAQIGDLILALEDRLDQIRETSPMDKFISNRMSTEQRFIELAGKLGWPPLGGGDLYGLGGHEKVSTIGYDRYYRFASIASRDLLADALSALAGIEEAHKDDAIEAEDAAKKLVANIPIPEPITLEIRS